MEGGRSPRGGRAPLHLRGGRAPLPPVLETRTAALPLPSGRKYIQVQLLTGETLVLAVDVKCKVQDVFDFVCQTLRVQDSRVFGLTYLRDLQEHRFLDLSQKMVKVTPKSWKSSPAWGTDETGSPTVILHLRVQVYVDFVRLISCPVSLLHYYLQLRENARIHWSEATPVPEERCWEVAALALQADYGDYTASRHTTGYFRPQQYFPLWVINSRGMDYIARHMPPMHQDLQGMSKTESMVRYCREVSRCSFPVNIHLYGLRRSKHDPVDNIVLGIATRGLQIFEAKPTGAREHVCSFLWKEIGKLSFEKRKFTLGSVDGKKLLYFTSSDEKSRYLLQFCRQIHQKTLSLQNELSQACSLELQESRQFRESYVYSSEAEVEWAREIGHWPDTLLSSPRSPNSGTTASRASASHGIAFNGQQTYNEVGQRVSVVSDASSNTTSGIVSDRQHNHEDSDGEHPDEVDLEIEGSQRPSNSSPLMSELSLNSPAILDITRSNDSSSNNLDSVDTGLSMSGAYSVSDFQLDDSDLKLQTSTLENPMDNSLEMGQVSTSEKTITEPGSEDCQSIGTTTIASDRLVPDDISSDVDEVAVRKLTSSSHHTANPDDMRLSQLALCAEETIVQELSALMQCVPRSRDASPTVTNRHGTPSTVSSSYEAPPSTFHYETPPSLFNGPVSKLSIAELRKQTLSNYENEADSREVEAVVHQTNPSLPLLTSTTKPPLARTEALKEMKQISTSTQTLDDDDSMSFKSGGKEISQHSGSSRSVHSEGTQTSTSFLTYFREKQFSRGSSNEGPLLETEVEATWDEQEQFGDGQSANEMGSQVDPALFARAAHRIRDTPRTNYDQSSQVSPNNRPPTPSAGPQYAESVKTSHQGTMVSSLVWEPNRKTSNAATSTVTQQQAYRPQVLDVPTTTPKHPSPKTVSLQNLNHPLPSTSPVVNPPNYDQAMRQRATNKRWTTISGVDPNIMSAALMSQEHTGLHQANSEPGLANSLIITERPYVQPATSFPINHVKNEQQQWTNFPRVYSASTNQITALYHAGMERPRSHTAAQNYQMYRDHYLPPSYPQQQQAVPESRSQKHPLWQQQQAQTNNGVNGMYTRNQNSRAAVPHFGMRGSAGSYGISRVQSMPDSARGQRIRQQYQEREVADPPPYPNGVNVNNNANYGTQKHCCPERKSSAPGYCNDCLKDHSGDTMGKAHFSQVKDLLKQRGRDFPFIKALMQETEPGSRASRDSTPPAAPKAATADMNHIEYSTQSQNYDDSNSAYIQPNPPQASYNDLYLNAPPQSLIAENGRPVSWGSFLPMSSSPPPYLNGARTYVPNSGIPQRSRPNEATFTHPHNSEMDHPRMNGYEGTPNVGYGNGYVHYDFYHSAGRFASTPNLTSGDPDLPPPPPYPCRQQDTIGGYGRSNFGAAPMSTVLR